MKTNLFYAWVTIGKYWNGQSPLVQHSKAGEEFCVAYCQPSLLIFFRTTIYGYYLSLSDSHARCGDDMFRQRLSPAKFRWAWYGFFELVCQTISFKDGFMCKNCGPTPDKVIMDATALSHRKSFATWEDFLRKHSKGMAPILDTKR